MFLVRLGNESGCNAIRALWGVFVCAGVRDGAGNGVGTGIYEWMGSSDVYGID